MSSDLWQWIAVGVLVAWAVWRIVVHLRSKRRNAGDGSCGCGCAGCDAACPIKDEAKKR